ncbi:hypothetical protein [Halomonas sp. TA22]|uniref:hypothetical protein n=1 Tax=Halomonadaceae TaxID=28256 RepID=UPI00349FB788
MRDTLAPLPCELRLLLGNHDDRTCFHRVFPDAPIDSRGFVQSSLTPLDGKLRLLFSTATNQQPSVANIAQSASTGWPPNWPRRRKYQ